MPKTKKIYPSENPVPFTMETSKRKLGGNTPPADEKVGQPKAERITSKQRGFDASDEVETSIHRG